MIKKIFGGFGYEIIKRGDAYFISYDSGESAGSKLKENEISLADVKKAMKSEKNAYEVIVAAQNRER